MNILAIDGGGIRGVYAAHLLGKINKELGINFSERFDLIAGTSTGSIIAAALATNHSIDKILSIYEQHGEDIFSRQYFSWFSAIRAKYGNKQLKKQLNKVFGCKTLSDTYTNLMIPATDIGNACVHVFKSPYDKTFVRDRNVYISDAVLASCSAPSYFKPHTVNEYLLADGGLWANNPSLACIIEALKKFDKKIHEIKLLSIGCGIGHHYYDQKKNDLRSWGLITGWGGPKLIDSILNLQSESTKNMAGLLLNKSQYIRINFETTGNLSLDDTSIIANLKSRADKDFTHNSAAITELFLNDNTSKEAN